MICSMKKSTFRISRDFFQLADQRQPDTFPATTVPRMRPCSCFGTRAADGVWYCIREYYYSGRDKGKQKTDSEYADDLKKWLDGTKIKAIIVDPSAASFIAELRKRGYKVMKAKNDVLDGIRLVGMLLNLEQLDICQLPVQETIKEFASYIWDEKALEHGEDKPVKQFDHCCRFCTLLCAAPVIGSKLAKAKRHKEVRNDVYIYNSKREI